VTSTQSMAYSFQPLDEALDSLGINYIDGVPVKIAEKYKINCDLKEVENIINNTQPKLSCLQSDYDTCFEKKVLQDLEQYQINKTQKLQERKDRIAQFDKRREEEKERIRQEEEKRKLEEELRIQEEEKRRAEEEEERLREEKLELLRQKEEQERKALEDERIRLLEIERERKKSQMEAEAVTHQEAPAAVNNTCSEANVNVTEDLEQEWKQFEELRKEEWKKFDRERAGSEASDVSRSNDSRSRHTSTDVHNNQTTNLNQTGGVVEKSLPNNISTHVQGEKIDVSENVKTVINNLPATAASLKHPTIPTNFNFKDFEAETDVFADMELKTINEMAELSTILAASKPIVTPSSSSAANLPQQSSQPHYQQQQLLLQQQARAGGQINGGFQTNFLFRLPHQQQVNQTASPILNYSRAPYNPPNGATTMYQMANNGQPIRYPSPTPTGGMLPSSTNNPTLVSTSSSNQIQQPAIYSSGHNTFSTHQAYSGMSSSSAYVPTTSGGYTTSSITTMPNSVYRYTNVTNQQANMKSSGGVSGYSASNTNIPVNWQLPTQGVPFNQSLGSNVTRTQPQVANSGMSSNYNNVTSQAYNNQFLVHNGYSSHSSTQDDPRSRGAEGGSRSKSTDRASVEASPDSSEDSPAELKPSRSVGDILSQLQEEARSLAELKRKQMQTPPPPTSASKPKAGMENWTPWPDIETKNPNDILQGLGEKEAQMCRQLHEMGFPLQRLAKGARSYGADSQKLLNFCVAVDKLVDRGYREDACLEAVILYPEDETKTRRHLDGFTKLAELGFDKDNIHQALNNSDQDYQKALEKLI